MFPGFVLSAEVTDQGWWLHDWEGDQAMLELAHRNACRSSLTWRHTTSTRNNGSSPYCTVVPGQVW